MAARDDDAASDARVAALIQAFMGAVARERAPIDDAFRAAVSLLITVARADGMRPKEVVAFVQRQARRYLTATDAELARRNVKWVPFDPMAAKPSSPRN